MSEQKILNYVQSEWVESRSSEFLPVFNPATQELLGSTPLSLAEDVDAAARAAQAAFPGWRRTPPSERIQYLFHLKRLLDEHIDEIARLITMECGKTFEESKAEMRRAIENVEVACGIPTMMKGDISEDIAPGIDEIMLRQPVGVCSVIAPFNFPGMIPFWFLPYALACGNTYIVKPSERVPLTMQYIFQLVEQVGLPEGVLNLVNGGKEAVNARLRLPDISTAGRRRTGSALNARAGRRIP
jgi:malonate-semialdehyde dehydrogenase (acetylating)/methylmalonate-semialdehyde dehydrogenase